MRKAYFDGHVKIYLEGDASDYRGSTLITGFRGFGMVGYNVSKYLALGLWARKVGYVLSKPMPPMVVVEEDGPGFPFDIYYSPRARALIVVNRALPEREHADIYVEALSLMAKEIGVKLAVLVGGLNSQFKPEGERYEYRYLANEFYGGPELDAPEMEEGLGVMGPLALLYMYMTYDEVPSIIILPYAIADRIDVNAARTGIRIIAEKILNTRVNTKPLDEYERRLSIEKEKLLEAILPMMQQAEEEKEERKGMYM